jgi:hypothetical protein
MLFAVKSQYLLSKLTAWAHATTKMKDFKGGNSKYSPITDRLLPLR